MTSFPMSAPHTRVSCHTVCLSSSPHSRDLKSVQQADANYNAMSKNQYSE